MSDTDRQTAERKVLRHFTMSLDGFVAGPSHGRGWMTGFSPRPGLVDEYVETTGAILTGPAGWDVDREGWDHGHRPYGGASTGPIFILTHHPADATPAEEVTFLSCDVSEAVQIGLDAADSKNLEVSSPTIGQQFVERGLIDEIDLHIAPVLLRDGIRLYDHPGARPIRPEWVDVPDAAAVVNVRYHPVAGVIN